MIDVFLFSDIHSTVLNMLLNAVMFLAEKFPEVPFSFAFIFSVKINTFSVIQNKFP